MNEIQEKFEKLEKELKELELKLQKELAQKKTNTICEILQIDDISIIIDKQYRNHDFEIKYVINIIDKKTYSFNLYIDNYNNCSMSFIGNSKKIPISVLSKIRLLINYYLENKNRHTFRSGTGFLISYYENLRNKLTTNEVLEMCKLDDKNNEDEYGLGFRNWLLGDDIYKSMMSYIDFNGGYNSSGNYSTLKLQKDFDIQKFIIDEKTYLQNK